MAFFMSKNLENTIIYCIFVEYKQNKINKIMNDKLKMLITITAVTCIIGLALSYVTQLAHTPKQLNFLEAIGVYCLLTPIYNYFFTEQQD